MCAATWMESENAMLSEISQSSAILRTLDTYSSQIHSERKEKDGCLGSRERRAVSKQESQTMDG